MILARAREFTLIISICLLAVAARLAFADETLNDEASVEASSDFAQLRVQALFESNRQQLNDEIMRLLRQSLNQDRAIYSARLFPNLKGAFFDVMIEKSGDALRFAVGGEYLEPARRPPFLYSGQLDDQSIVLPRQGSIVARAFPLVRGEFFLLVFDDQSFKSPIKGATRAQQALACQAMREGGLTFSHCELISSSEVLGGIALEGYIGGPYYLRDDHVVMGKGKRSLPIVARSLED